MMRITTHYLEQGGAFIIRDKGRIVGRYGTWAEFNQAMDNLDRLQAQLERPEAFCDCQDIYTKGKR